MKKCAFFALVLLLSSCTTYRANLWLVTDPRARDFVRPANDFTSHGLAFDPAARFPIYELTHLKGTAFRVSPENVAYVIMNVPAGQELTAIPNSMALTQLFLDKELCATGHHWAYSGMNSEGRVRGLDVGQGEFDFSGLDYEGRYGFNKTPCFEIVE